jgi:uncharacterized membrane protein (UPF0127 family)
VLATACAGPSRSLDGFETVDIAVGGSPLTVTLAETTAQRSQGLRGIEELPQGVDGMLFAWDAPASATFGMRDTLIPLDIWWFDQDGRLLGSTEMTTCPDGDCVSYGSPGPIQWALETPVGEFDFAPGSLLED